MKKSNALMLSYIIFLAIAFFVNCFSGWGGLGKVAMAATLAGLFFAIADLISWRISCERDFCKTVQKALTTVIASVEKLKLCAESIVAENKEIIELISPYDGSSEALNKALQISESEIASQKGYIEASETNKSKAEALNKEILDIKSRTINKLKKAETIMIVLGFVSFFVVSAFDYLYTLLFHAESSVTVIAFGVIMVTYFLKDVFENKQKKELETALGALTDSERILETMMQDVTDRKRKKSVKDLIEAVETKKALTAALAVLQAGEKQDEEKL
ncbi:MAG: hypothetical protein E7657_03775 [Ruminococcaceae bacterium]|nr:hypothetical protein [Oscillospiraceae bacterium]